MFRFLLFFCGLVWMTGCQSESKIPEKGIASKSFSSHKSDSFDYYLLAMSWSPEYCFQNGTRDGQQCRAGRRLGFVLHGLWPQFERGYPQNCSAEPLPQSLIERFEGLYPSNRLFTHEWRKHGTCSQLSPEAYLSLSQRLKQSLRIPRIFQSPPNPIRSNLREMKSAFSDANQDSDEDSFAPICRGRYLRELHVCYDTNGNPRRCSAEILRRSNRSCRTPFTLRNVR